MRRLNVILLALMMFFSLGINAEEEVKQEEGPVQAIQSAIVKLNQLTATAAYSPQMMNFLIDSEVTPMFDFNYIANEVLLVTNNRLGEEETKFFTGKLKKNIISTLLARLSQANSVSLQFVSARPIMGGSIAVQLKVNGYSSFGIYIDLLFHQNNDKKWQIFDVVLNNDSLINYYQKMVLIKARRYGIYGMLGRI